MTGDPQGRPNDSEPRTEHAPGAWDGVVRVAVPLLVALLVVLPVMGKGWLFLLDWVRGPHVPVPKAFWGLDGGLLAALPFALATLALGRLTDPATLGWLPIAVGVFTAGLAMGQLVGGPLRRRIPAGLLYAVNPLVFERVYAGQVAYVLAYALFPLAVASLLKAQEAGSWGKRLRPVLWITLLVGLAPHFAWITAVVCLVLLATRRSAASVKWLAAIAVVTLAANAYLVIPAVGRPAPVEVGAADVASFRTSGDPRLGLFANVASLYGFWRQGPSLPKEDVPGWPLFLAGIVLLAGAGARTALRRPEHRRLAGLALGVALPAFFLALGDQGPTGALYDWLFLHAPGFAIMREPQKFVALLALAYSVLFGFGADDLVGRAARPGARRAWTAVVLALPLAYTPSLFWGLGGQLRVGHYPASWHQADQLMGDGEGKVLFLPWHQYLGFPFTGRVVANPAPVAFRRDTIAGDNVELQRVRTASRSTRSAYLEYLYTKGTTLRSFGQLVAPHGVRFVVLAKTVDWKSYEWLGQQIDLRKVFDSDELVVYRNTRPVALGKRVTHAVTVADWGEVVGLSESTDLSATAVRVRRQAPGAVRSPVGLPAPASSLPQSSEPSSTAAAVERRSDVSYEVAAGPAGLVLLAEPFDPTWHLDGRSAVQLAGGTAAFSAGPEAGSIRFGHWSRVRLGYAISLVTLVLVLVSGLLRSRTGKEPSG